MLNSSEKPSILRYFRNRTGIEGCLFHSRSAETVSRTRGVDEETATGL